MIAATRPGPAVVVILGAGGDLTWRKLLPSLYDIYREGLLPDQLAIIGVDLQDYSETAYRKHLAAGVSKYSRHRKTARSWKDFASAITYLKLDITENDSYQALGDKIDEIEKDWNTDVIRMFYLAVAPSFIEPVALLLSESGLTRNDGRSRVVVEKPFGRDYKSARKLNEIINKCFEESSIYRIDHFLGKDTVQNIVALRFANAMFEPLWNRNYIDHVQLTVLEDLGIGHRGTYYDRAGALRDMVQNHLLQLLCLTAMETPVDFTPDILRSRKADVLRAVRNLNHDDIPGHAVRGQYGPGKIGSQDIPGYRQEEGISDDSCTETYAALKLYIDNWRWQGVPFYMRTGKRICESLSMIVIQFRAVPHQSFPPEAMEDWQPNRLIINIHPNKGIRLRFQAKRPGLDMVLNPVDMEFNYSDAYSREPPDAYETLLLDILLGDATLFMRRDQIEAAWEIIDPVTETWDATVPPSFPNYTAGTWGPDEARDLLARDGRAWFSSPRQDSGCKVSNG